MIHELLRIPAFAVIVAAVSCGGSSGGGGVGGGGGGGSSEVTFICGKGGKYITLGAVDVFQGTNGTFTDHCDNAGNLVTYTCESTTEWVCDELECYDEEGEDTGVALELPMDCGGTCTAGTCESRCPHTGDVMQYLGPIGGGQYKVKNLTTGWDYHCTEILGSCQMPAVGAQKTLDYYEAKNQTCMGSSTAAMSFGLVNPGPNDIKCVFRCSADVPAP